MRKYNRLRTGLWGDTAHQWRMWMCLCFRFMRTVLKCLFMPAMKRIQNELLYNATKFLLHNQVPCCLQWAQFLSYLFNEKKSLKHHRSIQTESRNGVPALFSRFEDMQPVAKPTRLLSHIHALGKKNEWKKEKARKKGS